MYLLVDATNVAYRSEHALALSNRTGSVSAVYGTLLTLRSVLSKFGPCRMICFWDTGRSWRSKIYPAYKQNRNVQSKEEQRADVYRQISLLKPLIGALGVLQLAAAGYEADDLIAAACRDLDGKKVIVSGDRDLVQLIDEETSLYYLHKKVLIEKSTCRKVMGLPPVAYLHKRILEGDASDNIRGVPGIGDKLSTEIINIVPTSNYVILTQQMHKFPNKVQNLLRRPETEDIIKRNTRLMDLRKSKLRIPSRRIQAIPMQRSRFKELCVQNGFTSMLEDSQGWFDVFHRLQPEAAERRVL